ncbi:hypothetical protein AgCh_029721 [Apium graveolens]
MLDWVKKIHHEKKFDMLVDKDLKNNYDRIELEEIVKCTDSRDEECQPLEDEGDVLDEELTPSEYTDRSFSSMRQFV